MRSQETEGGDSWKRRGLCVSDSLNHLSIKILIDWETLSMMKDKLILITWVIRKHSNQSVLGDLSLSTSLRLLLYLLDA